MCGPLVKCSSQSHSIPIVVNLFVCLFVMAEALCLSQQLFSCVGKLFFFSGFARVCSHADDFNTRNKCLTAKLLKQGYRYHKLSK